MYRLSHRQFILSAVAGAALIFSAVYLFYLHVPLALAASLFGLAVPKHFKRYLAVKRQEKLRLHFKEMLFSLSSSLAAGRSVENAIHASLDDLRLMYPESRTDLMRELEVIWHRFSNGDSLEAGLVDFAARSGVDELLQFTDVFTTCKRTGGDLVEIIRRTSQIISEKIEINQEIGVMIAQKRFEARIMLAVPFGFMAFLHATAPDYLAPLYERPIGYVLLTGALALMGGCCWLMFRIMRIDL